MGPPCRDDRGLYPAGPPCRDSRGQPCPVGPPCRNAEGLCSLGPPRKDSAVLCPVGSPCGDAGASPKVPSYKDAGGQLCPAGPPCRDLGGLCLVGTQAGILGGLPIAPPLPQTPRDSQTRPRGPCGTPGVGAGSGHWVWAQQGPVLEPALFGMRELPPASNPIDFQ